MEEEESPTPAPSKQDVEKTTGKLRKKLREIAELERKVSEDGAILKANQKEKLAQKETVLAELSALTGEKFSAPCCSKKGG